MSVDPQLLQLGAQLADASARNGAAAVLDRIRIAKARKKEAETIAILDEIVSQLMADKGELVQIAQAYEQELVAQRISEGDIAYITSSVIPVVKRMIELGQDSGNAAQLPEEVVEILSSLVSVETVTVLQLLGFNFKRAVGEPLTELIAGFIAAKKPIDPQMQLEAFRASAQKEAALAQLAKDAQASKRFEKLSAET